MSKHTIEWFRQRAGQYVYRNSTVSVWKDVCYLLLIPAQKHKGRRVISFEREIRRLYLSQELHGLTYSDKIFPGKQLSTIVL